MTDRLPVGPDARATVLLERAGDGLPELVERGNRGGWYWAVVAVLLACAMIRCAVKRPVAPVVTVAGQVRR